MERQQSDRTPEGSSEDGYRGPQVCNIVGITYRQLDYWARTDLLRPSISDARGSGTQRIYGYTDLVQLKVIKQLLVAGVSLRSTRKAIECLRASGASVTSASLVIADDRSVLAHSGEELFDLLHGGQGVLSMVLGMDKIVSEVDAAITEFKVSRSEVHPAAERSSAVSHSAAEPHPAAEPNSAAASHGATASHPAAEPKSAAASHPAAEPKSAGASHPTAEPHPEVVRSGLAGAGELRRASL